LEVDLLTIRNDTFTGPNLEVDILTVCNLEVDILTVGNLDVEKLTIGNLEVDTSMFGNLEDDIRTYTTAIHPTLAEYFVGKHKNVGILTDSKFQSNEERKTLNVQE
jgi:hypothetical protein